MTHLYCMVYCTYPSQSLAEKIAHDLTEAGLIACASIIPHLTSIYAWEGKVVKGEEVLLLLKTHQDKLARLEEAILAAHPYQFPEFLAVPIVYGNKDYLAWVGACVGV